MDEREQRMRLAAFAHVERLSRANGGLTYHQLTSGFRFEDEYIPLVHTMHGISKPRALQHLLSLLTAWPTGARSTPIRPSPTSKSSPAPERSPTTS